jgi:hypothetical protein
MTRRGRSAESARINAEEQSIHLHASDDDIDSLLVAWKERRGNPHWWRSDRGYNGPCKHSGGPAERRRVSTGPEWSDGMVLACWER